MNKKKKIPAMKSDNDIAAFWDNNDFTDFADDTESAGDVVFEKPTKETISVRLEKKQIQQLKKIAQKVGLGYTSLIRSWVIEKIARLQSASR